MTSILKTKICQKKIKNNTFIWIHKILEQEVDKYYTFIYEKKKNYFIDDNIH